jgi:hypothetical protein
MARSRYDGHPERMPMDGHGVLGLCGPGAWFGVAAIPPPPPPPAGGCRLVAAAGIAVRNVCCLVALSFYIVSLFCKMHN